MNGMPGQARFLLINGSRDDWHVVLEEALAPLGALQIEKEENVLKCVQLDGYDLLIIDATVVENVPALVVRIRAHYPGARIIVTTASPTWRRAREAFQTGVIDYIRKSLDRDEMRSAVQTALDKKLPSL
jgi:DNA-binding NtrC family response regulator